jgi:hypothetical protein
MVMVWSALTMILSSPEKIDSTMAARLVTIRAATAAIIAGFRMGPRRARPGNRFHGSALP